MDLKVRHAKYLKWKIIAYGATKTSNKYHLDWSKGLEVVLI
jgi:hypothetical protein